MNTSGLIDPLREFMESARQVQENIHHIARLERQADIALLNMKADGVVDNRAFDSIVGRAIELRLIDKGGISSLEPKTIEAVEGVFDFIKHNMKAITDVAFSDPNEYAKRLGPLSTPIRTADEPKRRHFSDLIS